MQFKITCFKKDVENWEVFRFTSPIVPKVGEVVYGPHRGVYRVKEVWYHISDDQYDYSDKLMFVCLYVDEWKEEEEQ